MTFTCSRWIGMARRIWSKTYGGPLDEMVGASGSCQTAVTSSGAISWTPTTLLRIPGGGLWRFAGRSNLYLLKVDGDGNELWSRAYDSEDNVLAASGALTPDGGLLALATITHYQIQMMTSNC